MYLAAPVVLALYLGWKAYSRDWRFLVPISEMDMTTGLRLFDPAEEEDEPKKSWVQRIGRGMF